MGPEIKRSNGSSESPHNFKQLLQALEKLPEQKLKQIADYYRKRSNDSPRAKTDSR